MKYTVKIKVTPAFGLGRAISKNVEVEHDADRRICKALRPDGSWIYGETAEDVAIRAVVDGLVFPAPL